MKLSRKTEYALRALSELAHHAGQGRIQARELARRERIPRKFLEQILLELRRGGLVESRRGAGGGYALSRSPDQISVAAVASLMDGPVALAAADELGPAEALESGACGLPAVLAELSEDISRLLAGVSLADIQLRSTELRARALRIPQYSI